MARWDIDMGWKSVATIRCFARPASSLVGHSAFKGSASALAQFNAMGLGGWVLVDLALNWGGWALAAALKTERFYDLVGSLSFVTLTIGSLALAGPITARKLLVSCMVGLWAGRLGSYLVARVHKVGKDSRFDEVKHQPAMFLFYWTMQALWVFITLTPVLLINTATVAKPLAWFDAPGVCLWASGLMLEAVADWQKDQWRAKPQNKGRFITTGLWGISRHPNYLGEMMLWYVSGVPILERQADQRWGSEAEYQAYKASTPVLVPDLSRLFKTDPSL
ncbi:hypothetical protein QJQ45_009957 [Haematococcus lacustris]|nr:hypothetical protein QJQ45_009957 [Haematococcus lacustris]